MKIELSFRSHLKRLFKNLRWSKVPNPLAKVHLILYALAIDTRRYYIYLMKKNFRDVIFSAVDSIGMGPRKGERRCETERKKRRNKCRMKQSVSVLRRGYTFVVAISVSGMAE